ncbi:XRE family transcriptional regulator [Variovorax ginsengisoli]|uniref:S24 family peptidase n=1 Tax=Variovorax ginsengisoli TaxID=363844 RepID=A0ABT8SDL8_9BURK|nr:S24 family peptidase [Variovorax ginsengisoli]MDN8617831.1 S24 family peptidase [Variovorax ginsengisoli]MDO1537001.1 S24 family peptidase [Variovorax ginsengisoli]
MIKTARDARGWSMEKLAEEVSKAEGLTKPLAWQTVQQWEKEGGTAPKRKRMEIVARLLRIDVHALITEGKGSIHVHHPEDELPPGVIRIPESAIAFSAGNGHTPTYEVIEDSEPVVYQLSWFQKMRINPAMVRRFKVKDDSAEPLLYEGDSILVNHAETDVVDGKLYAFRYGDDLRVKRLFKRLDGTLILRSVNPSYKDEEVPAALVEEHITIIGRVRDKAGSGGL